MKKNVLVILRNYPLGMNAGDKIRTLNMCMSLSSMGYNVFLLGFYTRNAHRIREEKRSLPKDVKALFFPTIPNRFKLLKLSEFLRALVTYFVCKIYSIDIIQAEMSISATSARFVSRLPLITDFHADAVPEFEMMGYPQSIIEYTKKENVYSLTHSKKIITVSDNLYRNLMEYVRTSAENFVLPTNINIDNFRKITPDTRSQMRKKYNLEDRIVLCYSGGLHKWQCVEETISLVVRLWKMNPNYFFCLYSNDDITPYEDLLMQINGHYLIKGVPNKEIASYLSMIDVGFVLRANDLVNINSSPTKTSEYLAAGAMVVATQYAGDSPKQIQESGCGLVLNDLNPSDEQLVDIDAYIQKYYTSYKENSEKAKSYVTQNRLWTYNESLLKHIYQEL
ncbi:glycosyltransferase involved in cell wall biosynthesis [Parabacteroides sp. PFB2-10]|uniref:hypothetical protein n=1 Tax=Parabacteroides sp. PFB2-10 TaxID=1742405 RepID=UPI002473E03D|nr:hypothetical protein [Parabacteroides sp. PFB2-10]MDH6313529.1 glycosyltransferase involved in cell wall biosynthesis [Parabacteroides sp. PFB2-10]